MRTRRETAEHPFGTLKMWMGATHFLMKTLPKVATEMALHVLAYNLTRVMNIVGNRSPHPDPARRMAPLSAKVLFSAARADPRRDRSLADFAKLVELFDAHGVSFVSVT